MAFSAKIRKNKALPNAMSKKINDQYSHCGYPQIGFERSGGPQAIN